MTSTRNTLLSEREVYKIHEGDNHSARTKYEIGDVIRKGWKCYKLADKIIFEIDRCPHCGSKNTFHARSQRVRREAENNSDVYYDNVYKTHVHDGKLSRVFHKIDLCLSCHKEFHIEIFCWTRIGFVTFLKEKYINNK